MAETRRTSLTYHGPGTTQRAHRRSRRREQMREKTRREDPSADDAVITQTVLHLQAAESGVLSDPRLIRRMVETEPTSRAPDRHVIKDEIEEAAIRRQPEAIALREALGYCAHGRPSNRSVALACIERQWWGKDRKEIKAPHQEFTAPGGLRDWAYGYPLDREEAGGTSLQAVYRTAPAALERNDPRMIVAANVAAIRRLSALGHPEIGRYLTIDGVAIEGDFEQRQGVSPAEERLLRRGQDADFKLHDSGFYRKSWRGWTMVVIGDIKSTLPVVWVLFPASTHESRMLFPALDLLYALWPDCPAEYLIGDSAYSGHDISLRLERDFGIHPVVPIGPRPSERFDWASSEGVPTCAKHGLMKRHIADGFQNWERRRRSRRTPGMEQERFAARIRWRCEECNLHESTYVHRDARLYTFLPRKGEHGLAFLRCALSFRRNTSEAIFSNLEHCGFALRGQRHSRWATSGVRTEWLVGGGLLAQTLRRVAHASGTYEDAVREAQALNLL
jgi:hypothetical protein